MKDNQFQFQVERLKEVYGAKNYSMERVSLFKRSFGHSTYEIFKRAVDELISNQKFAPLKAQIVDAVRMVMKEMPEELRPSGCNLCAGIGRIIETPKNKIDAVTAYACDCELGVLYSQGHGQRKQYRPKPKNLGPRELV